MLNLFMARECMNKEEIHIRENIKEQDIYVLVRTFAVTPEDQALKYTGSACLL